ncbi:MAG TPA: VOC family protein [Chloroflexota bacterium]
MADATFHVEAIDHVEVCVPDRYEAAEWYRNVFGLEILKPLEEWAVVGGPLMLGSNGREPALALFEGEPLAGRDPVGLRRVAFRVDGAGFCRFLDTLDDHPVFDDRGTRLTPADIVDHDKSFSIYFCDPYGNWYELTTYDYDDVVRARIG